MKVVLKNLFIAASAVLVLACSNSNKVAKIASLGFEKECSTSSQKIQIDTLVVLSRPSFGDSVKYLYVTMQSRGGVERIQLY